MTLAHALQIIIGHVYSAHEIITQEYDLDAAERLRAPIIRISEHLQSALTALEAAKREYA